MGKKCCCREIEAILFDLDGVLVPGPEWHEEAFNLALEAFNYSRISHDDHMDNFNGLSTYKKLDILIERGCSAFLDNCLRKKFYDTKQDFTEKIINEECKPINRVIDVVDYANKLFDGNIGVVTNCSRKTTELMLNRSKLFDKFKIIITNEDVDGKIKPHPWPYLKGKLELCLENSYKNVLVIDDTSKGIVSAIDAQCRTWKLNKFEDLSVKNLVKILDDYKITV